MKLQIIMLLLSVIPYRVTNNTKYSYQNNATPRLVKEMDEQPMNIARKAIDPYIQIVRGRNNKLEVYESLNEGQRGLFSFYVYFDHAKKGIDSYLYYSMLYIKMNYMEEIAKGSEYFMDNEYAELIRKIENTKSEKELVDRYQEYIERSNNHIKILIEAVERNIEYFK